VTVSEDTLRKVVREEIRGKKRIVAEELSSDELQRVREIVRRELSEVFYDLFKRRGFWVDRV
jgi:hypothetical protein